MKRAEILLGGAAWVAFLVFVILLWDVPMARSQSRYDTDQKWVRQTIRETNRKALENYYGEPVEFVRRPRPRSQESHHHHYDSRDWRYRERQRDRDHAHYRSGDRDAHVATRVYGVVMRREQFVQRDATSHVQCYPPMEAMSHERSSQDDAWNDAQRAWANAVRFRFGERYQDIRNANPVQKQCNISSVSETVAGKMIDGAKAIVGADTGGSRWRCLVRAGPCQAEFEVDPNVRGEPKQ